MTLLADEDVEAELSESELSETVLLKYLLETYPVLPLYFIFDHPFDVDITSTLSPFDNFPIIELFVDGPLLTFNHETFTYFYVILFDS